MNFMAANAATIKIEIHVRVDTKPMYTSGSAKPQPRPKIARNAVVACVSGSHMESFL